MRNIGPIGLASFTLYDWWAKAEKPIEIAEKVPNKHRSW